MVTSPRSISTVTGVVSLASVSLFLFLLVWSPVLFSLFLLLLCCSPGVVELKSGHLPYSLIEFFFEVHKNDNNANIGSRGFTKWKQKNPVKNVTSSGNRTLASHNLWFQVQHYPFWTKLTFACKTETLGSLYSHALLILTESSKSKRQVVHEQKF